MQRFFRQIVRHPKAILTLFALATLLCAACKPMIAVNYDINDYLPSHAPSTRALDALEAEYDSGVPNARVMVRNVTIPEALRYKAALEEIPGVTGVTWLDDSVDETVPLETVDQDLLDTYYLDGNALFSVTIAEHSILPATDAIRALIGPENAMTGAAVSTAVATTSTVSEVRLIALFAVAFVFFLLIVSMTSWLEPVIVMLSLGVAILINSGSNLIFGEISFVTNAAGSILQLAVSLDYSVFLMHRFEECKREIPDRQEAMVDALCKSATSILSSGLTTVIGFLALCLMQFRIGPDLGLALAKGVGISLITVFFFSPVLILSWSKGIDRTRHRSFLPSFAGFGKLVTRVMLPLVCVFALIIAPSYLASQRNDYYYGASHIFGPETQLGADTEAIEEIFGRSDTYALMVPRGDFAREQALSDALQAMPEVTEVLSYVDNAGEVIPTEYVEADTLKLLLSDAHSRMVVTVRAEYEGEATFALIERIRALAERFYPGQWLLAGEGVSTYDLMDTVTADMAKVNFIAIAAVFLVLTVSFKSASLPALLVLAIETAIWLNTGRPYFAGQTVFYIAYLIITSIQLGATVDYAILMTDRYCEFRQTMDRREAAGRTVASSTASILVSGLALTVVGFLMGIISTHGLLSQLGYFLGWGAVFSLAIVLLVLPGLLCVFDGLIQHTTRGVRFVNPKSRRVDRNEEVQEDGFAADGAVACVDAGGSGARRGQGGGHLRGAGLGWAGGRALRSQHLPGR